MTLDDITAALRTKVGADSGLNAVLVFDCGTDGAIRIDAKGTPNAVTQGTGGDADCTVAMSLADLSALVQGELDPAVAYMTGRMKVSGDMSVALRLQRVV